MIDQARRALREHFGFERFRPGQERAVGAALAGRDALVVMPTGSGKSLCYQLPALIGERLAIVVSPLVSLMQDQVEALERVAPGRVALVNAQQSAAANQRALERALAGELRLLYIAPERFASPGFVAQISRAQLGLFVVDEAHCVSQWGHDFRPDYFRLAAAARYLGARSLMALTATATPRVAADVARRLELRDPVRVRTGFDRPNLSFAVARCRSKVDKHRRIAAALLEPDALPAIVYAGTRAGADTLARELSETLGEPAIAYHAGLDRAARAEAQRRFMDGEARVVVATNAFGMGVDKADVRTVCHETVPQSVEAYYQEAGRAGRDGRPARCLLFAEGRDKGLHVFFIQRSGVDEQALRRVAELLIAAAGEARRYDLDMGSLTAAAGGEADAARAILGHLSRAGVIRPSPSAPDRASGRISGPWDRRALASCRAAANEATRVRWRQYRAVWEFVEGSGCRRAAILRHFGDTAEPAPLGGVPCCDVCDPSIAPAPVTGRGSGGAAPDAAGGDAPRRAASGGGHDPRAPGGGATGAGASPADLDAAIVAVVRTAEPPVGRTRAAEILRGGRSKIVVKYSYDGLEPYGTYAHLSKSELLERIDELLGAGRLRSTGGRFPKLVATA